MSCIVTEKGAGTYSVVKGSPEVILHKLADSVKTEKFKKEYLAHYESLAHRGMRVLAMAYKEMKPHHTHRDEAESDLKFAGFASFACETRADSATVIRALAESAQLPCIMVTGDSVLTAVHVARQTGICRSDVEGVLRLCLSVAGDKYEWHNIGEKTGETNIKFDASSVASLAVRFDLVVSGEALPEDESSPVWTHAVSHFRVFARMSPQQKERVIARIRADGGKPLMCGDGGNDVGALKQADVGVALLAGFGAANTAAPAAVGDEDDSAEDLLEKEGRIVALKEKVLGEKIKAEFAVVKKALMAKQQDWLQEELAKPGNGGYWMSIKAVTSRMREEMAKEAKVLQTKYGVHEAWGKGGAALGVVGGAAGAAAASAEAATRPVVQMGDASVAAPFTSRAPSIRAVVQIVRQGRCTLLVAVQMMQIMMLESLISAYTFAAITMEGGRSTEIQLIGSSVFVMVASIAFTYAKPAKRLSNVIPLKSVFHPAIFVSVVLQVLIHLGVLVYAMSWAKTEMGEKALTDLYSFERERDEQLTKLMSEEKPDSGLLGGFGANGAELWSMFKSVPYRPNLLNTVMFLVKTSQQVSVLVVNYKGSPWMQGALENKALFLSMFACAIGIVICSTGYIPYLNDLLELLVLPPPLRNRLLLLLAASTGGTLLVDRLVVLLFAPRVFVASTLNPLMSTRIADFVPILKTCGYMVAALVVIPLALSNPIALIGSIYMYRQYRKWQNDKEMAELQQHLPPAVAE